MKSRLATLILALTALTAVAPRGVEAAAPRVPADTYPPHSHISYVAPLSNEQMDCMWGFFCEGSIPVFHVTTERDLHRLDGWAQFAGWHHNAMTFELFASRYSASIDDQGTSASAAAFTEFAAVLRGAGYRCLHPSIRLPVGQGSGGVLTEIQR